MYCDMYLSLNARVRATVAKTFYSHPDRVSPEPATSRLILYELRRGGVQHSFSTPLVAGRIITPRPVRDCRVKDPVRYISVR
jgi:hypothetical protein